MQLLSITEDLLKVCEYLHKSIPNELKALCESAALENWIALAELVEIGMTIFNRQRANEVFGLLIKRFLNRKKWKKAEMEDVKNTLIPFERQIMNR